MGNPLPVLINRAGGCARSLGASLANTVHEAFVATGRSIDLELLAAGEMEAAIRRKLGAGAAVIAVGGGDGTLGGAAAILANSNTALAILPLGTRNHLARQLGVPMDLAKAAKLAVDGQRRRIDLGAAGERVFVNNASFGLYTRFVRERDSGDRRWHATVRAAWHVLRNVRAQTFTLRIDGEARMVATPLLFIGNNKYALRAGHVGERESLTEHRLALLAVAATRPLAMIGLGLRAVAGLASPASDFFECGPAREVIIEGVGDIEGTFDGELVMLPLPLRLRAMPNALGVVTPREQVMRQRTLSRTH